MRASIALCLALAALAPQAALGERRDIVFECPCSAVFTPDADGEGGTLDLDFGLRSFRDSRSMALGLGFHNYEEDGPTDRRRHLYWPGRNQPHQFVVPAALSDGVAPMSVAPRARRERGRQVSPSPLPGAVLVASLAESLDVRSSGSGPQPLRGGRLRYQDELALWPVPGAQRDGAHPLRGHPDGLGRRRR